MAKNKGFKALENKNNIILFIFPGVKTCLKWLKIRGFVIFAQIKNFLIVKIAQ